MKILARALAALLLGLFLAVPGQAQDRIGVILMHGKQGSARDARSGLPSIASALQGTGDLTIVPLMPWSSGGWESIKSTVDQALDLIDGYAAQLRSQGATRIVVGGHSLGANIALSYAVERGNVAATRQAGRSSTRASW